MKKTALNQLLGLGAAIGVAAGLLFWLSNSTKEVNSVRRDRPESSVGKWSVEDGVRESDTAEKGTKAGGVGTGAVLTPPQRKSEKGMTKEEREPVRTPSGDGRPNPALAYAALTAYPVAPGAGKESANGLLIRVKGSDTMIQLMTAWAEAYHHVKPHVQIQSGGGGTGIGVSALIYGYCDIVNASRELTPKEREKLKAVSGKDATEFVAAYDALAVYTNPKNPIKEISVEELREIWAEGGSITSWDQVKPGMKGKIVLFGRQNNSGTYDYFREKICGRVSDDKQREFRSGISEMNGSAEIVENVARTPQAIGYAGMGYKTDRVNWLKISSRKGEPGVEPGTEVARSGTYPIARKLYLYTAGEPTGEVKDYIDWILSPAGQKIVEQEGFVPLK